jgi:CBS domain-containing protein
LFLPIKLFLMRRSRHIKPPVVCNAYTSLETAVLQMALFRLHRLWVVDANNKPIAVLSAFDVMKQFIAKE